MIRYELGEAGLADIRFAISPLTELGLSLRALRSPASFPLQLAWSRQVELVRADLDLGALLALVSDDMRTPDFLNPYPSSPLRRIDEELDQLAELSVDQVRRDLVAAHGQLPEVYSGRGRAPARRMLHALGDYWRLCLEPHWGKMRAVLDADVIHRGRVMAQEGTGRMLAMLSPTVELSGSVLSVRLRSPIVRTERVGDAALTLVPTLFTRRASVPLLPEHGPVIMYAARGQGSMWAEGIPGGFEPLAELIGRRRASLLVALEEPLSTTTLGVRTGTTPSAVSPHLQALKRAGLVTSARHGRSVLYLRTELADQLLAGPG